MTAKFKRDIELFAGSLVINPRTAVGQNQPILKVTFDITKTNDIKPNTTTVSIWNLKEESRSKLQEKDLEIRIEAGYIDDKKAIFKGDIERTTIIRDSVNWVTTLELSDGGKQMRQTRINESFRGPQGFGSMLSKVVDTLKEAGLTEGNLKECVGAIGTSSFKGIGDFLHGIILSGKSIDIADRITSSVDCVMSVQDKSLQFLAKQGGTLKGPDEPLNVDTGLIGTPSVGEKGVVIANSLLNGRYIPGRIVSLKSEMVKGRFVCQKVQHKGDTWGIDWNSRLEMRPL